MTVLTLRTSQVMSPTALSVFYVDGARGGLTKLIVGYRIFRSRREARNRCGWMVLTSIVLRSTMAMSRSTNWSNEDEVDRRPRCRVSGLTLMRTVKRPHDLKPLWKTVQNQPWNGVFKGICDQGVSTNVNLGGVSNKCEP